MRSLKAISLDAEKRKPETLKIKRLGNEEPSEETAKRVAGEVGITRRVFPGGRRSATAGASDVSEHSEDGGLS